MSRTKGYKCFNIKCGSCIGKALCGEPEDTALVCVDRVIGKPITNADHIRSMTDEELAKLLLDGCRGSKCDDQPQNEWGSVNCFQCRMNWLKQPCGKEDKHENLD